uniref:DUF834 domain-containing protein n=1 Tax=Oryza meridionalis TaxID=40149 RepID=A0A0E0C6I2_9ORYZ
MQPSGGGGRRARSRAGEAADADAGGWCRQPAGGEAAVVVGGRGAAQGTKGQDRERQWGTKGRRGAARRRPGRVAVGVEGRRGRRWSTAGAADEDQPPIAATAASTSQPATDTGGP